MTTIEILGLNRDGLLVERRRSIQGVLTELEFVITQNRMWSEMKNILSPGRPYFAACQSAVHRRVLSVQKELTSSISTNLAEKIVSDARKAKPLTPEHVLKLALGAGSRWKRRRSIRWRPTPAGDPPRTWFPEMVDELRKRWRAE
jgi:hypothetical protein